MFDPVQRRRYGIYAIILAMVFFGVSAAAGVGTAIRRAAVVKQIASTDQECSNRLGILGAKAPPVSGDSVTAKWDGLDGGYDVLARASAGALACPGWTMKTFCMGQGCSGGSAGAGATLTLVRGSVAD